MQIGLLGTLTVRDDAGHPVRVPGHRVRLLLILLALDAGRIVPAYSLIERLWDGDPPVSSANSLQSLVSRLRASLRQAGLDASVIESHPVGYRLAVSPHEVDAMAFEELAREGSQAQASGDAATASRVLRDALGAWRGPALADASGSRFAAGPAARLEELRARAALDLIEAGLALGESDGLIGELRAIVSADPVAERPRGLLMRALYAAGRQAEALAVYQDLRELLATGLGVDPSPQLERIYLSVLRQELERPPGPPPSGQVPGGEAGPRQPGGRLPPGGSPASPRLAGVRKPLTSFVGRDEDVTRVEKMLAEGRLVTLTGPGGAGKTRLAVETAALLAGPAAPLAGDGVAPGQDQAQETGQDQAQENCQVWFADLTPVTDPAEVPYAALHTLGIRESPVMSRSGVGQRDIPEDPVQRLVAVLGERRGLLILDNCEHVVAAAATLADQVLAGCPSVRVLATSREPLRVAGEALWPVPPLPVPPPPAPGPGEVMSFASVRLLADRAAAVRPGFTVTEGNAADVARICRALDGVPLAIELAAARLRALSAAQLADRLDARFELLTGGSRTAVPRHQTLRAVVDWSWELLSGPEQMLARRLAIFPGGATLTAAEQVCHDAALPVADVLPALFGLVEKSFVTVAGDGEPSSAAGGGDTRYRMLETIRVYCLERLAAAGEEDQVRHAFAGYFLDLAETADPLLRRAQQRIWLRRLTAEQDNMHAALRRAIAAREPLLALRFGAALGWFWMLRGQHREFATIASDILAISGPGELTGPASGGLGVLEARAICALTALNANWDIAGVKQPLADAEPLVTPGPGAAGRPPHPLVVAGVAMLGLYEKRDPGHAIELLAAHTTSPDPWTRYGCTLMHAFFSMSLGRMDGAAGECAKALAGFQEIGDRWGMALALMGQAEIASLGGDHAGAIAALEEAVRQSRELLGWGDTSQMHASLAKSRSRLGDYEGASADLARAEQAARAQGESQNFLWIAHIRAELMWLRGDLAEVRGICRRLDDELAGKPTKMSGSFRALVISREALAKLRTGSAAGGLAALAGALRLAVDGQDQASVAAVMDALAAAVLWAGEDRASAERAAAMLGAAHAVRGAFDHGSLDAPPAAATARRVLGDGAFDAVYQQGQALGFAGAVALAEESAQLGV